MNGDVTLKIPLHVMLIQKNTVPWIVKQAERPTNKELPQLCCIQVLQSRTAFAAADCQIQGTWSKVNQCHFIWHPLTEPEMS